ncbi:MAG TPA: hypothetical protein PL190_00895 [Caldisericia bacterium]|nr:hypothetical protein [Caldisericia bacterium]HOC80046.1 hypothetical protein [Caldisericia bacterium]HOG70694.1 hypothetical protein [Caldisericia bacterium]HPA65082.1 hypothetical protein [Caldisericia bacterium]HPM45321.1 hypothetical protein [Caldisericia bacterium]
MNKIKIPSSEFVSWQASQAFYFLSKAFEELENVSEEFSNNTTGELFYPRKYRPIEYARASFLSFCTLVEAYVHHISRSFFYSSQDSIHETLSLEEQLTFFGYNLENKDNQDILKPLSIIKLLDNVPLLINRINNTSITNRDEFKESIKQFESLNSKRNYYTHGCSPKIPKKLIGKDGNAKDLDKVRQWSDDFDNIEYINESYENGEYKFCFEVPGKSWVKDLEEAYNCSKTCINLMRNFWVACFGSTPIHWWIEELDYKILLKKTNHIPETLKKLVIKDFGEF